MRDALALELEHIPRLGALAHLIAHAAVDGRYRDLRAERCLRKRDRHLAPHVVAAALKDRVRPHVDIDVQVAAGPAVRTRVALAGNVEHLVVVHARGDVDLDGLLLAHTAAAVARMARRIDHTAGTTTAVARAGGLHHAERRALVNAHLAGAAAL